MGGSLRSSIRELDVREISGDRDRMKCKFAFLSAGWERIVGFVKTMTSAGGDSMPDECGC